MAALRRLVLSSWPPMVVTGAGLAYVALRVQLPATDLVAYAAYLLLGITLPGTAVWRGLLHGPLTRDDRETTWFQDLSLGTAAGFAIQLPVYLVGVLIGLPQVVWVLPVLVALSLANGRARSVWTRPTGRLDPWSAWALAGTALYGAAWFAENRIAARPLTLELSRAHIDESFHQALTSELLHHVPPSIPFVAGEPMNYHWYSHAQMAATRWATGLSSPELLRVVFPLTVVVLTVLVLGAVATHLAQRHAAAAIAPALLIAGGFHALGPHFNAGVFLEPYLTNRIGSSPSFTYGVLMSLPVFLLVGEVLQRRTAPATWRVWLALAVALLVAGGAKATVMPVLVCASIGAWALIAVLDRRPWNAAAPLTALAVLATLFTQYVVFGGRSPGLYPEPFAIVGNAVRRAGVENGDSVSTVAAVAMLGTMLIAWMLYGVGAIAFLHRGAWRNPAVQWLAIAALTGITVPFVLYRQGWSVLWFSKAVAPVIVLLGTWGLVTLLPRTVRFRTGLGLLATALATATAALLASIVVEGASSARPGKTDLTGLLVTCAIPVVIVAAFLAVRGLSRMTPRIRRPALLLPVAMLSGLSLVTPMAFGWDLAQGREFATAVGKQHFARGALDAARTLKRRSDPDDLVATNAHCMHPKRVASRCDNRHFWISAHTERRVLIEGWGYTGQSNALSDDGTGLFHTPSPFPDRLAASDAAFERPSAETVGRLVDEYDVDWLFVDKRYPVDMQALRSLDGDVVDVVLENPNYAVLRPRR